MWLAGKTLQTGAGSGHNVKQTQRLSKLWISVKKRLPAQARLEEEEEEEEGSVLHNAVTGTP